VRLADDDFIAPALSSKVAGFAMSKSSARFPIANVAFSTVDSGQTSNAGGLGNAIAAFLPYLGTHVYVLWPAAATTSIIDARLPSDRSWNHISRSRQAVLIHFMLYSPFL
jgi:hypothetical protein